MSVLSKKELQELIEKAKGYDYIRFSWPDLNGIPRGKTVTGANAEEFIRDGVWEMTGKDFVIHYQPSKDSAQYVPVVKNA